MDEFEEIIDYYIMQDMLDKADKAIIVGLNQHPATITLFLKKAQLYTARNEFKKALRILDDIERLEPGDPDVYKHRAMIYSQSGEHKQAIVSLEQALDVSQDERDELFAQIAFEYESLGDYDQAIRHLKKALKANPDNEGVIYEIAFCFDVSGRMEDAVAFLQNTSTTTQIQWPPGSIIGVTYKALELYEKAVEAFDLRSPLTIRSLWPTTTKPMLMPISGFSVKPSKNTGKRSSWRPQRP